jgi:hypothetical protein
MQKQRMSVGGIIGMVFAFFIIFVAGMELYKVMQDTSNFSHPRFIGAHILLFISGLVHANRFSKIIKK